ncbi:hypothetical protein [Flavobacterium macrobrachii]|uniref:Uncharacterized protein n=1 Tax=Flavobacterium macrobrachii TaxID=591204 RepID=A0ABS2CXU2_9FLAO|nr:hypothetical protein [Flavobacterium macrobrachii]MBM6499774.1 hypothetical protein [Flavobacterium macrobrachii]
MNKHLNPRQIKTIQNFWNWFQDNEQAIYNACKLEINKDEVLFRLQRNLNYVSKRIEYFITNHPQNENKLKVFFTAHGYKKLFPKMNELEEKIPSLQYFAIQVYITPLNLENPTISSDLAELIQNTKIKLEDYNTASKKIILSVYFNEQDLNENKRKIEIKAYRLLLFTLGEVKYKKHIANFNCETIPPNFNGLLTLSKLPEFIDYLAKINYSRKLKIFFE